MKLGSESCLGDEGAAMAGRSCLGGRMIGGIIERARS